MHLTKAAEISLQFSYIFISVYVIDSQKYVLRFSNILRKINVTLCVHIITIPALEPKESDIYCENNAA